MANIGIRLPSRDLHHSNTFVEFCLIPSHFTIQTSSLAVPLERACYSLIFISASFAHFRSNTIEDAAHQGAPAAGFFVPVSGVMALLGGFSILLGLYPKIGAILLIAFLAPVTFSMHNFWSISDPMQAQVQMVMFMKNISMLGAAILIYHFGSGPLSIKHK